MEEKGNVVKFKDENGNEFEMVILKEFENKNKKYAVLMGMEDCDCDDDCDCGCHEEKECDCDDCSSGDTISIVEIAKDKDGNEIFKGIEDDEEYNELVDISSKLIFGE